MKNRCQKDFKREPHLKSEKNPKSSQHRPNMGSEIEPKRVGKELRNHAENHFQKNMNFYIRKKPVLAWEREAR